MSMMGPMSEEGQRLRAASAKARGREDRRWGWAERDARRQEQTARVSASRAAWVARQRAASSPPASRARVGHSGRSDDIVCGTARAGGGHQDRRVAVTASPGVAAQRRTIEATGREPQLIRWRADYSGRETRITALEYR